MRRIEFINDDILPTGTSYLALMMGISIVSLFIFNRSKIIKNKMVTKYTSLMIWVYFISILFSSLHPFTRANYILIILPLFLLYFTSNYTSYIKSSELIVWCMTVVAVGLLFEFAVSMTDSFALKRTSGSYYIIYFLPFLLCHKNKIVKLVSIILVFAAVVVSVKIGGVLSVGAGLMTYWLIKQKIQGRKQYGFKSLFILPIIVIFLYVAILYLDNNVLGGFFLDHMDESRDSGGSGRIEIYNIYIKLIFNSSIFKFLFGHGWLGSEYESNIGLTCHNDFLEAFFDFGLIGFILYVMFIFSLFSLSKRMIRQRNEYAPVMCTSVVMFFINSMVAHIFIYPWYLMIFSIFWGFVISNIETSKISRREV